MAAPVRQGGRAGRQPDRREPPPGPVVQHLGAGGADRLRRARQPGPQRRAVGAGAAPRRRRGDAPVAARQPDRAAEPGAVPGPPRARRRPQRPQRARALHAAVHRRRRLQGRQRLARPPRRGPAAARRRRPRRRAAARRATPWRGSAATSSPCCSRTPARTTRSPRPTACCGRCRRPSSSRAARPSTSVRASALVAGSGGLSPEELLRDADVAMYRAKGEGKNRCTVFEPAMRDRLQARSEMEAELRTAIVESRFAVHYQPVVDLSTGRVVVDRGARALGAPAPRARRRPASSSLSPRTPGSSCRSARPCCARPARTPPAGAACRHCATSPSASTCRRASCRSRPCSTSSATPWRAAACRPARLVLELTETLLVSDSRRRRRPPRRAQGARRAPRGRRLRHRLLVAVLPVPAAGRHPQGRPRLRRRARHRHLRRQARRCRPRRRRLARPVDGRRGRRDDRAGQRAARAGMPSAAGLPLRPPRPGGSLPATASALEDRLAGRGAAGVPVARRSADVVLPV